MPTKRFWAVLLSAPALLGGLVLLAGGVTAVRTLPTPRPPLVQLESSMDAPLVPSEVELTLFSPGQGGRGVEQPVFVQLTLPEDATGRFERLGAELRAQLLATLWPAALPAPTVFEVDAANGAQTVVVLDFSVDAVAVDVETELLLLRSVHATLLRNGADRVQILVNHAESASFLGHVALAAVLEN